MPLSMLSEAIISKFNCGTVMFELIMLLSNKPHKFNYHYSPKSSVNAYGRD